MKLTSDNKIIEEPLHSYFEEGTFDLINSLEEENFATPFNFLKNCALIRTYSIIGYKLPSDYIHLLEKEQLDEN
jgi:hypothetical protein